MGVPGLLKVLDSITNKSFHISALKNKRIGIDALVWLHRTCHSYSEGIIFESDASYDLVIKSFMDMLSILISNEVTDVIVIFDGLPLPLKQQTDHKRRESRESNYNLAMEAKSTGDDDRASKYFKRSVSIPKELIDKLMKYLASNNINFMTAPYEADAQLAYLSMAGLIDTVITEDSDAIVFGARHVIYKLERSGEGHEIFRKDLYNVGFNINNNLSNNFNYLINNVTTTISFTNWSADQFVLFCCLTGSDYLSIKIKGLGIKTSYKLVCNYKSFDDLILRLKRKFKDVTNEFVVNLYQTFLTYKYQTIYDPIAHKMNSMRKMKQEDINIYVDKVRLVDKHSDINLSFLGELLDNDLTYRLVRGIISSREIKSHTEKSENNICNYLVDSEIDKSDNYKENCTLPYQHDNRIDGYTNNDISNYNYNKIVDDTTIWGFTISSPSSSKQKSNIQSVGSIERHSNSKTVSKLTNSLTNHINFNSSLLSNKYETIDRRKRRKSFNSVTNELYNKYDYNYYKKLDNQTISPLDDLVNNQQNVLLDNNNMNENLCNVTENKYDNNKNILYQSDTTEFFQLDEYVNFNGNTYYTK